MGTPFKMKGHTLPGPNQRESSPIQKSSPARFPWAAVIGAVAAIGGAMISKKGKEKEAEAISRASNTEKSRDFGNIDFTTKKSDTGPDPEELGTN